MNQINLFKETLQRVPAYKKFCMERKIDENTDWNKIPLIDKESYLLKNPVKDLCWDGDLSKAHLIGASSGFGKSGTVFWPKRVEDEKDYIVAMENMLVNNYHIDNRKTLILVCLAFGTWIAGMQIASTIRFIASSGKYPIICATPGLNIKEAVEIYKLTENEVEQTLIITNPSNINIFISLFKKDNLKTDKGNIFFPVVGEYIPEKMRIRISDTFGHDENEYFSIWTGFGSADVGDLGYETPAVIGLRKYIYKNPELSEKLFNTTDTPMIFATNTKAFIEIIDNEIIVTKNQLIPLIRYNTKDRGDILYKQSLKQHIPENIYENLPDKMLIVFGRTSDSIIFYGTNLSVGNINDYFLSLDKSYAYGGLFQIKEEVLEGISTFKFIIFTADFQNKDLVAKYKEALLKFLMTGSNEFKIKYQNLSSIIGEKLIEIKLEDISKLEGNLKHKYII